MVKRLAVGTVIAALLVRGEPQVELRVPRRAGAIAIDGELEDPGWRGARSTRAFVDPKGDPAHPHSEARFVWDDDALYVLLYAADEDIEAEDDAFHLVFENGADELAIDVSARGVVADDKRKIGAARPFDDAWTSGARVGTDVDGTYDDPSDDDEEWVLEVAIPLTSLGVAGRAGERLAFTARRCDTPRGAARTCASYPGQGRRGLLVFAEADR